MTETSTELPRAERIARGKALRASVSRESHASWGAGPGRDPLAVLAQGDADRLPSLVPRRYALMAADPFAFLRGSAAIMAADLVGGPGRCFPVQACGDCHMGNFGVYRSPEGGVLFDINDFDETLPGVDFSVDVKRLAASVAVAALFVAKVGPDRARRAAKACVRAYRRHMRVLSKMPPLVAWQSRIDLDHELKRIGEGELYRHVVSGFDGDAAEAKAHTDIPDLAYATQEGPPADWKIADKPPKIFHEGPQGLTAAVQDAAKALRLYPESLPVERRILVERYATRDVAFKVVGIGSVGTVCAVALCTDADGATLFLQIKEAKASVLAPLSTSVPGPTDQGQRVIDGQRVMQAASDLFLGTAFCRGSGRFYYVRHLKSRKLSSVSDILLQSGPKPYARLCGTTLARAHARSGDAAAITGYLGRSDAFDTAVTEFAMRYARQTQEDHALLRAKGPGAPYA